MTEQSTKYQCQSRQKIEDLDRLPIEIFYLSPHARAPEYAHSTDAGADLFAAEAISIEPGETVKVGTGLVIVIPSGFEIQIRSRSGLALKHGISVLNSPGTIDAGYLGEVGVILHNHGRSPYLVNIGDRIAQAVLTPVYSVSFEVKPIEELGAIASSRGAGGFGSTGS